MKKGLRLLPVIALNTAVGFRSALMKKGLRRK